MSLPSRNIIGIAAFLCFIAPLPLPAQDVSGVGRRGDDLTLKIAVIGPGDELYFWWGHIGLVVEDRAADTERFFDWGVFSFGTENFFANFAYGRLVYFCAVSPAEANYRAYIHTNRDITLYTLDLPAEKKEELLNFAENNMLPENRDYLYHHFNDNCATRIRDIIDLAVDGKFRADFGGAPGRYTLRQHVRRHTWASPFFDWLLNFLMGQRIDAPITVWDEMFLPSEIAARIGEYRYMDADGVERPLVSAVEIVNRSEGRPGVLDTPRLQWPRELAVSVFFSALLLAAFFLWGKRNGFRVFMGVLQSFLGLFFGIAGSLLFFMSFFTLHDYTYSNINLLYVNPLFLAACPLGLVFAFSRREERRASAALSLKVFWCYVIAAGVFTMLAKLLPAFYQRNQVTLALLLPAALTVLFVTWRTRGSVNRKSRSPR